MSWAGPFSLTVVVIISAVLVVTGLLYFRAAIEASGTDSEHGNSASKGRRDDAGDGVLREA